MTHTLIDIETLKVLMDAAATYSGTSAYSGFFDGDPTIEAALATAEDLIKNPTRPQVVANISGGVLQGASSDYPVDLYTLDFDTDGADEDETIEVEGSRAILGQCSAYIDPKFVSEVISYEAAED